MYKDAVMSSMKAASRMCCEWKMMGLGHGTKRVDEVGGLWLFQPRGLMVHCQTGVWLGNRFHC